VNPSRVRMLSVLRHPLILAAAALIVRLVWLRVQGVTPITWDGAEYARGALSLLQGGGFVGMRGTTAYMFPPLYSLAIAAMTLVTGHPEAAGIAVSVLCGTLLVFPVYGLAARMYGRRAALVAGAIIAFLPFAVDMSVVVLSESLFTLLAATALYVLVRSLHAGGWRLGALSGALFGLAYLTRPEGLVLGAAGVAAVVCASALEPGLRRRLISCAGAMVLALVVVGSPYVLFLSAHAHTLSIEAKSATNAAIAAGMQSGLTYIQAADGIDGNLRVVGPELDDDGYFVDGAMRRISLREKLAIILSDARRRAVDIPRKLLSKPYGTPLVALLAAIGIFAGPWRRRRIVDEIALFGYAAALFVSLTTVYHFWDRYAFGFTPLLAVWAGHGVDAVTGTILARVRGHAALRQRAEMSIAAAVVVAAGLAMLLGSLHGFFKNDVNDAATTTERTIGTWIAAHDNAPGRIMTVSDQSAFYANATWTMLPYVAHDQLALDYVRHKDPRYLVLDRDTADERPYVIAWLAHGVPDPRARLVHVIGDPRAPDAAIYRWTQTPLVAAP
jgi:Dolichyl-phosphate-mannose-protein mannosyltransferase